MKNKEKYNLKALLCVSILLMSLLLTESLLSLLCAKNLFNLKNIINLDERKVDQLLIYSNRAGSNSQYSRTEFSNNIVINSKGMRDDEKNYSSSKYRILVLGDSFVIGKFVPLNSTFQKLLEKRLNNTEVISMGVSGWGTRSERIYYAIEGYKYRPDMLIVLFHLNDFGNNIATARKGVSRMIFDCSHFSKICYLVNWMFFQDKPNFEYTDDTFLTTIEEIANMNKYNDDVLFIIIPYKFQVDGRTLNIGTAKYNIIDRYYKKLIKELDEININYIDLTEPYKQKNINNTFFWDIDGHWNKAGIDYAVNLTYEYITN